MSNTIVGKHPTYISVLVVCPWEIRIFKGQVRFDLWGGERGYLIVNKFGKLGSLINIPPEAYVKGRVEAGYDMEVTILGDQYRAFGRVPSQVPLIARFLIVNFGPTQGERGVLEFMLRTT